MIKSGELLLYAYTRRWKINYGSIIDETNEDDDNNNDDEYVAYI